MEGRSRLGTSAEKWLLILASNSTGIVFLTLRNPFTRSTCSRHSLINTCKAVCWLSLQIECIYIFRQYEPDDLIRFILTVRKNYRKVPYHNWAHGWTGKPLYSFIYFLLVAHSMFVFLRQSKKFEPLEALALFVAAICHDLDHRGNCQREQVARFETFLVLKEQWEQ